MHKGVYECSISKTRDYPIKNCYIPKSIYCITKIYGPLFILVIYFRWAFKLYDEDNSGIQYNAFLKSLGIVGFVAPQLFLHIFKVAFDRLFWVRLVKG